MDDFDRERIQTITAHIQTMFRDLIALCRDLERARAPEPLHDRADDRGCHTGRQRPARGFATR